MMKFFKPALLLSLVAISTSFSISSGKENLNETATDALSENIGLKLNAIRSGETYSCSRTFVQPGSDENGNRYLRFATAVKGDIETLTYTRKVDGKEDVRKDVTLVYRSIQGSENKTYYYDENTGQPAETDPDNGYYWACYTIRFSTDSTYVANDIEVSLTINQETIGFARASYRVLTETDFSTVSFERDETWIGTCYAPKDSSVVYPGYFESETTENSYSAFAHWSCEDQEYALSAPIEVKEDMRVRAIFHTVSYSGFKGIYQGTLANLIDNDDATHVWFSSAPETDGYVLYDLGEEKAIGDIRLYNGNLAGNDPFISKLEYSSDGNEFTSLKSVSSSGIALSDVHLEKMTARYIRLYNDGTETWVGLRELGINTMSSYANYGNMKYASDIQTDVCHINDDDIETYTWFNNSLTEGAYVELDLLKETEIHNVQILMSKPTSIDDYFKSSRLSYSSDGIHYTDVRDFSSRNVYHTFSTPLSARYLRLTATTTSGNGVVVRDFSVNRDYAVTFGSSFKVYDYVRSGYPISHVDYATDGNDRTFLDLDCDKLPQDDRTITLNLFEAKTITSLEIVSGGISWGDKITDCTIEYSLDGTNYKNLGQFTSEDGLYHLSFDPIEAKTIRITVNNSGWITLREISAV